jgi:predicted O-linked N-acetylglucosamine transferase (SPINDLY family)
MPELIAYSAGEYVERAVKIARTTGMIEEIKHRIMAQAAGSALFHSRHITRKIEAAYQAAMTRAWRGLPPDHLDLRNCTDICNETD